MPPASCATRLHNLLLLKQRVWRPTWLQGVALVIAAVVLLPMLYLVVRAAEAGSEGVAYLLDERTLRVIWNSLLLAVAVTLSSAVVGVALAWLTTRTNLPLRRVWLIGGLVPMVIPSYIGAVTFIAAFGPRGGLQRMLEPLGVTMLPPIYGFFGAWAIITLFTYPYVALPVRAALLSMDSSLEEAAHSLGLRRREVFWRVTLPQLRPALASGMLLAALYTLSDFGAVALMRYDAFTRVIYSQYTNSFDRSRAAILALVLVVITLALMLIERRTARITRNYLIGVGTPRRLRFIVLGRWTAPALTFCVVLVSVGLIVPVVTLVNWTLIAQPSPDDLERLAQATINTVSASGLAAVVVSLSALPLALLAIRAASPFNRVLARVPYLGNSLPGIVVALALVFFGANYLPAWYQTLPILILGYTTRFLPLSVGATSSALTQINPRIEESGRSLGLSPWQVMLRITVPLAQGGILAGIALVFLSAMKELPTTLLLSPTGFQTFATHIWRATNEARYAQVGAPALALMVVSGLSLALILSQGKPISKP